MEYTADGQRLSEQPSSVKVYSKCVPVYEEMEGWPDISESEWVAMAKKGYDSLPKQAKDYVTKIETIARVPVKIVSIGEMRDATINRIDVWKT